MTTFMVILVLFGAGCLGGFTNAAMVGEMRLPHTDSDAKVFRPGWLGNVLVGGVAAVVFWGLYGPMADAIVVGPADPNGKVATLLVSELFAGIVTGIGGGRLLTFAVEKQMSQKEIATLTRARDKLADAISSLTEGVV